MSINKEIIGILLIATTMLLSACSSDDSGAQTVTTGNEPVDKVVHLVSYISPLVEKEQPHRAAPSGFSAYSLDKTTAMGIYTLLSDDWADPKEEKIIYNNNKWHAYFNVEANKTYTVYGYLPKTENMRSELAKSATNVATLTIENIKPVTTDDICIITGVKETDEGLKEGQFSWTWPIGNDDYFMYLLLDHLYAAVQFCMKIDGEYAQLRTIKLKTMTLSTNKGSVNAAVTLTHNTEGTSPIADEDDITYISTDGSCEAQIFNNAEGLALSSTTPIEVNASFAPTLSNNLTMVTTYDLYDRKGNLIRENSKATNKLPNLAAVRGQKVQVNLTVNPTYLYVLSEPDLDNPTITIGD